MTNKSPFDFLCGCQCIVGDQLCPGYYTCPVNEILVKGMLTRYFTSCRRELKRWNRVSLQFNEVEKLIRHELNLGFVCPACGVTMTFNSEQTTEDNVYTLEHVVPMGKGGPNTIDNIILSCSKCNNEKNTNNYRPETRQ